MSLCYVIISIKFLKSLALFLCLCVSVSVCKSISVPLWVSISISLSLSVSMSLCVCVCVCLSLSLSLVCLSLPVSTFVCVCLSLSLSVPWSPRWRTVQRNSRPRYMRSLHNCTAQRVDDVMVVLWWMLPWRRKAYAIPGQELLMWKTPTNYSAL